MVALVPFAIAAWGWLWRDRFLNPDESLNTLGVALLVSLFISFAGSLSVVGRIQRRYGVTCPKCKKLLAGPARTILLSKGCCCDCGHQIFAQPPDNKPAADGRRL